MPDQWALVARERATAYASAASPVLLRELLAQQYSLSEAHTRQLKAETALGGGWCCTTCRIRRRDTVGDRA